MEYKMPELYKDIEPNYPNMPQHKKPHREMPAGLNATLKYHGHEQDFRQPISPECENYE